MTTPGAAALVDALEQIMALLRVAPEHLDRMRRWEREGFNDSDNTAALAGTDRTILVGQLQAGRMGVEELRQSPDLWPADPATADLRTVVAQRLVPFFGSPEQHLANWRNNAVSDDRRGESFTAHPAAILVLLDVVDAALAMARQEAAGTGHAPGDQHDYDLRCRTCGQAGTIRVSIDPQATDPQAPGLRDALKRLLAANDAWHAVAEDDAGAKAAMVEAIKDARRALEGGAP